MKISYIFERKPLKDKNSIRINTTILNYLPNCFISADKYLIYHIDGKEYKIVFKEDILYGASGSKFFITLEYNDENQEFESIVMEKVIKSMECKEINSIFYNIMAYDGVSEYYCNLAYPLINNLERILRKFIFIIVIKAHGSNWVEILVNDKDKGKIKENINKSKNYKISISEALYAMDFDMMIRFLFSEDTRRIMKQVPFDELETYSKETLLKHIKDIQLDSVWNIYFSEFKIDDLHNTLNSIREHRNTVAHSKHFRLKSYNELKNLIENLIPQLELAINSTNYKIFDIESLRTGISELTKTMQSIIMSENGMSYFLEQFAESLRKFKGENQD